MTADALTPGRPPICAEALFTCLPDGVLVVTVGDVYIRLDRQATDRLRALFVPEGEAEFLTPGPGKGGE